jgi:hypothetical protein
MNRNQTHPRSMKEAIEYLKTHRRVELTRSPTRAVPCGIAVTSSHCFFAELKGSVLWFGLIRRSKWGAIKTDGDPIGVRIDGGQTELETGFEFDETGFYLRRGTFLVRIRYLS